MGIPRRLLPLALLLSLLTACSRTSGPTAAVAASPGPSPSAPTETLSPVTPEPDRPLVAGQWNTLFYHPQLRKVVLVNGGPDRGKPVDDPLELWAWDGNHWTVLSADPNGPHWRNFAGAAFDTKRNVLVIHSGPQDPGRSMDVTWEWDGQTWKQFTGPGPGFREAAEMVYDEARGNMLLFGGANEKFEMLGDTWEWDGGQWTQVSTTGPPPRFPIAMVYDPAREKVLLFGGHAVRGNEAVNYNDLWEWDGTSWRELIVEGEKPTVRNIGEIVYHPPSEQVLLFGGGEDEVFLSDLWAWDGTTWTQVAESGAPARSGMGAAYDAVRDRIVAFGGVDKPGGKAITDTWEWDGTGWMCVQGCQ